MYAPFGAGALVGRRDWLDAAEPHLAGGGAVREVTTDPRRLWASSPERHEGGTPNVLGALALAEALRTLDDTGLGPGAPRTRPRCTAASSTGSGERGIEPLRIWPDAPDVVGVVSFTVPGLRAPAQVAAYLSAEHGIGVRDGRFCAHPLLARLGVADGAVRASLGVGTSSADVDRLLDALDALLADGPRWTYACDGAGCRPVARRPSSSPAGPGHRPASTPSRTSSTPCTPTSTPAGADR